MTDEVALQPDVTAMIEIVDFVSDADAEAAGYHKMTALIDIELTHGRKVSGRSDFGKGSPTGPMSYEEVAGKLLENADYAKFPTDQAKAVIEMVLISNSCRRSTV